MNRSTFAALFLMAFSSVVWAQDNAPKPVSDKTLSDFTIGEIISGDKADEDSLKGKVVALEFWGRNCGPCLAGMPQLAALDKRYKDKGLRLIGIHAQAGNDEEILAPVKKNKVKFSIARTGQSPIDFEGIPHMFIFNAKGELVFEGHPAGGEAEKIIKKELRSVTATGDDEDEDEDSPFGPKKTETKTGPLVAERTWTSADGRPLVATLLSVKNGTGTFKRKDGKTFDIALDKLSVADRKVIEDAEKKASGSAASDEEK
jgi:thiol-disulfide isomerase/thioredoxin